MSIGLSLITISKAAFDIQGWVGSLATYAWPDG